MLALRTSLEAIEERFRELTGNKCSRQIVFDRGVDLEHGVGAQICRLLAYLVNDAQSTDTILNSRLLRHQLDDMLLARILTLPSNVSDWLHGGREDQVAPSLVRRAEQFLEWRATEPTTISDVLAECGSSGSVSGMPQMTPGEFV